VPDHSTFSKNRHGRFRESEAFRHVFESVVERCMSEGLVGGEGFAVDASVIKADANRSRKTGGGEPIDLLDSRHGTRAVREYLAALDAQREPITPVSISPTDPAARWTAAPGGPAFYAYSTNYLVDVEAGIIVDVEATPALRTNEVNSTRIMIERVEQRLALKPECLIGDTAYGGGPFLNWLVQDKQIKPYIPVWDKSKRNDGTLSHAHFTYDDQNDCYTCPGGKHLYTTGQITSEGTILYRSRNVECASCSLKPQCCPNTPNRKIARSIYEKARNAARALAKSDAYRQSRKNRKKVEMLFAHLKRILKLDRLRLRGHILPKTPRYATSSTGWVRSVDRITPTLSARPLQAALMSCISFAAGGIVPLIPVFALRGPALIPVTAVVSLVFLAMLGAGAARVGGAPIIAGALRVSVWGAIAMAITGVVGAAFGVIL